MKIIFWLSLIGILYTYAGYPLAMWVLARLPCITVSHCSQARFSISLT